MPSPLRAALLRAAWITWVVMVLLATAARAGDKVVLQLKWEHEFQFAGFYAALWQGYYADAGLEVDIRSAVRPDHSLIDPQQELLAGRVDFAIGGLDILIGRDRGYPLVVLAPIFQKSPGAVFALENRPLTSPAKLAPLRIAQAPGDYINNEVMSLLQAEGIDPRSVRFIDAPLTMETLLNGRADALITYTISAKTAARERGLKLNTLRPGDYGIVFYGDTLYTHQRLVDRDPELVQRFVKASLDGWLYALEHRQEIADRISRELPRVVVSYTDVQAYNREFAKDIDNYLLFPIVPIGNNNPHRWEKMHQLLFDIGVVKNPYDGDHLFFNPGIKQQWLYTWLVLAAALVVLALVLLEAAMRSGWKLWLGPMLAVLMVLGLTALAENYARAEYRQDLRFFTLQQLGTIRARMEGIINSSTAALEGMATYVTLNPDFTGEEFDRLCAELLAKNPLLSSIAVAPDLVVQRVYPLARNEAVVGLDYRTNLAQRDAALRVRDRGKAVIAGPARLLQGGSGLIIRAPVFLPGQPGQRVFWGLLSTPMYLEKFLASAGLYDPELGVKIALRGRDALGASGDLFFGDPNIIAQNPVTQQIPLGDGSWQIAAIPANGWDQAPANIWMIRAGGLLIAALIGLSLFFRSRQLAAQRRTELELRRRDALLQNVGKIANVGGWEYDLKHQRISWSEQIYHIHERPQADGAVAPDQYHRYLAEWDEKRMTQVLTELVASGGSVEQEWLIVTERGNRRWIRCLADAIAEHGEVVRLVGTMQDITEKKQVEETIRYQANYDGPTGLPNRNLFGDRLLQSIHQARRSCGRFALLFIDLDNFKTINDSLGHLVGDRLLYEVAQRLGNCVRGSDTVARRGGDEFTVIANDIRDYSEATRVADKILQVLAQPYRIDSHLIHSSASIGITIYPDDAEDEQALVKNADQAMYAAKDAGRGTARYFTREMQLEADQKHRLHTELIGALESSQLAVCYQPIVELDSGAIAKCEALVRWRHAELGEVPPASFIPLAEETGLIHQLGEFVLATACRDLAELNRRLPRRIGVAINKSTREFQYESRNYQSWTDAIAATGLGGQLTVEITESLLLQDHGQTLTQLRALKAQGVRIAIDDFGTGYSALSYLRRFPVDLLKIDKSFVRDIAVDREARTLIEAIIAMAHNLGIDVVAEGVETAAQAAVLRAARCRYAQGYYFSQPLPFAELLALCENPPSEDWRRS